MQSAEMYENHRRASKREIVERPSYSEKTHKVEFVFQLWAFVFLNGKIDWGMIRWLLRIKQNDTNYKMITANFTSDESSESESPATSQDSSLCILIQKVLH